jgi:3-oxoacyl-[acyl-carrier protein] reductase
MDLGLNNKIALVTAASRGLGRAIAEELAAEGATVVVSSRNEASLEAVAQDISSATGSRVVPLAADLMDPDAIDSLVDSIEHDIGNIDILVANSGGPMARPFAELTDADWNQALNEKLLAQIRPCRAVLPRMVAREGGRIITMSGVHSYFPHAYAITAGVVNAGLLNLTKALAQEGAPANVLVNSINPGPIRTERMVYLAQARAADAGITVAEAEALIVEETLLKRFGEPADVGALVAFLVSERAGFITGSMFSIDGGLLPTI